MLISDLATAPGYPEALGAFVERHISARGTGGVPQAYAAVQQMAYFSGPDRTPLAALRSGRGACTAKHIILRDALRAIGQRADVEIVTGDFAAAIPLHASQDEELARMITQGGVTDFHCRTVVRGPEVDQRLDATWPVALESYGFAVNRNWTGKGDTIQAIPGAVVCATPEDVLATKSQLLAGLGPSMIAHRQEFLRRLSDWMAGLQVIETSGRV